MRELQVIQLVGAAPSPRNYVVERRSILNLQLGAQLMHWCRESMTADPT
jgi:hypothetical protein